MERAKNSSSWNLCPVLTRMSSSGLPANGDEDLNDNSNTMEFSTTCTVCHGNVTLFETYSPLSSVYFAICFCMQRFEKNRAWFPAQLSSITKIR